MNRSDLDKKKRSNPEDALQRQCITWFRAQYGRYAGRCWHSPNGGFRNVIEAKKLKDMGVLSGVSDIILTIPRGQWHGAFIELKAGKNTLSENQERFLKEHEKDYYTAVCYSLNEFMQTVNNYLTIKQEK